MDRLQNCIHSGAYALRSDSLEIQSCGSGDQARLSYAGRLLLSERLGNLDGKLPQVPASRQKIWAADVRGVLPVFHGFHSSCDAQNAGGY